MDKIQQALYDLYSEVRDDFQFSLNFKVYSKAELLEHIKNKTEVYEGLKKIEKNFVAGLATKAQV